MNVPDHWIKRRPIEWIIDHNPLYLLSGAAMLVGCFLLNLSLTQTDPDRVDWLIGLIVVFNVYEVAVIGLGLWLAKRMNLLRDAGYLLVLEIVLLSDLTLLYHRCGTGEMHTGLIVCGLAWVLAMAKIAVIFLGLNISMRRRGWVVLAIDLGALLLLPMVWRALGEREWLEEPALYAGWWLVGGLIALRAVRAGPRPRGLLARSVRAAACYLPAASVLIHLIAAHSTYGVTLRVYMFGPMLLGIATWLVFARLPRAQYSGRRITIGTLGVVALLLSMAGPIWFEQSVAVSPMRVILLGITCVWGAGWWTLGGYGLPIGSICTLFASGLGHDLTAMAHRVRSAWRAVISIGPETTAGWGWFAVILAFVLLGAGAAVSWLKHDEIRR